MITKLLDIQNDIIQIKSYENNKFWIGSYIQIKF